MAISNLRFHAFLLLAPLRSAYWWPSLCRNEATRHPPPRALVACDSLNSSCFVLSVWLQMISLVGLLSNPPSPVVLRETNTTLSSHPQMRVMMCSRSRVSFIQESRDNKSYLCKQDFEFLLYGSATTAERCDQQLRLHATRVRLGRRPRPSHLAFSRAILPTRRTDSCLSSSVRSPQAKVVCACVCVREGVVW